MNKYRYITIFLLTSSAYSLSAPVKGEGLYLSRYELQNALTVCAAGSGIKIDGAFRESIEKIYEDQKHDITAVNGQ